MLCAALADLELGMPGAAALSVGFGAGLQRFLFAPLPPALPQESKPLLIVAEDVEGETAPVGRYYVRSVVHTLQSDGAVDLLTCDYRPGGPELVHVVQQRGGVSAGLAQPQDEAAGESCADTLQESLFEGFSLVATTPVASVRNDTAALHHEFDLARGESAAPGGFVGSEILVYLILLGPPPLPGAVAPEARSSTP